MSWNKIPKWVRILLFIIFAVLAVIFSLNNKKVSAIISSLGSIASLYAIIEALISVKSIEDQNNQIQKAIESKVGIINKQETSELINKYIEVLSRVQDYITQRNAEAAIIKIEEVQSFLHNLQSNPSTPPEVKMALSKHIKYMNKDVAVLRNRNHNEQFPKDVDCKVLITNLGALHETLMDYSQKIHFEK